MNTKLFTLIIGLFLFSCCPNDEPVEYARYEFTELDKELFPYTLGDQVVLMHSAGSAVQFTVDSDQIELFQEFDFCEWRCCDAGYFSYEVRKMRLKADYPNIELSLSADAIEADQKLLTVSFNNKFHASIYYNEEAEWLCENMNCMDSLQIGEQTYYNVIELPFSGQREDENYSQLGPETLYYNQEGIIQITMKNGESYRIQ